MSITLDRLFGNKKPTSVSLEGEIAKHSTTLANAHARIKAADAAYQSAVNAMDKAGMRAAGAARLDADEDVILAERAISELRHELKNRLAIEAREALEARTIAAKRRVAVEAVKLLDRYERAAAEIASTVEAFNSIEAEVAAVNTDRRNAGLEPIDNATNTHRKEPDRHTAERRVSEKKWFKRERDGSESPVLSFLFDEKDNRIPSDGLGNILAGCHQRDVERVVERKRTIRGAELPSFDENLKLPPGRVGAIRHWPKAA